MLKTYQFKTDCKGDSHSSNCKYHFARTHDKTKVNALTLQVKWYSNSLNCIMLV